MIAAIVLALIAIAGGTLVSYAYDDDAPFVSRLAYGAATGLVALAGIGFVLANFLGIGPSAVGATVVVALPLLGLTRGDLRPRVGADIRASGRNIVAAIRDPTLSGYGPIVYTVALTVFLWFVFGRVILEEDGSLLTGYVNNLGDLPFHLQVTSSFAYADNFPPEDPTYAGTGFAYPYLSDFLAAMFVAVGASLRDAFFIQNLAIALALVGLLYRFTFVLTSDRLASFLAPVLVLLSGGLGWVLFLQHAIESESGILAALGSLTQDYTIVGEGPFRWGNAVTTLLVTQRSLLHGLPIALAVFVLLWKLIHAAAPSSTRPDLTSPPIRLALAAGLMTGALPLVHAHSFVVVMGTAFFIGLLFRQWRERRWLPWTIYVIAALALALPQIWWSTHDSVANAGTFFGFELGWDHGDENIAWFWLLNTGAFIPLALVAAFWPGRHPIASRSLLLFSAAFLAWFIVPNMVKLAPWVWDNIKVLFYWFVGLIPLVALLLSRMLRSGGGWRAIGMAAVLSMTLAGSIDIWRVLSSQTKLQEFDRDGIAVADVIRAETPARSLILHAPTYNPAVFLTGRRSLLGYTGYIWAHGLPYLEREADIKRIYGGEDGADELLEQYEVDYILVSPLERGSMTVNDAYLAKFPIASEIGAYRLHEVPRP